MKRRWKDRPTDFFNKIGFDFLWYLRFVCEICVHLRSLLIFRVVSRGLQQILRFGRMTSQLLLLTDTPCDLSIRVKKVQTGLT